MARGRVDLASLADQGLEVGSPIESRHGARMSRIDGRSPGVVCPAENATAGQVALAGRGDVRWRLGRPPDDHGMFQRRAVVPGVTVFAVLMPTAKPVVPAAFSTPTVALEPVVRAASPAAEQ